MKYFLFVTSILLFNFLVQASEFADPHFMEGAEIQFTKQIKLEHKSQLIKPDFIMVGYSGQVLVGNQSDLTGCSIRYGTYFTSTSVRYEELKKNFPKELQQIPPLYLSSEIKWRVEQVLPIEGGLLRISLRSEKEKDKSLNIVCSSLSGATALDRKSWALQAYMSLMMNGVKFTKNGKELKPYVETSVTPPSSVAKSSNNRAVQKAQ